MKITSVNLTTAQNKQFNQKNKLKKNTLTNSTNNLQAYPKNYYLSFLGGKSLNLAQTIEQIKKYGNFPSDEILDEATNTINSNNPDNKTLYDIHKEHYSLLNECENLDDAKELYPEFKNVLSSNSVKANKGSFINDVQSGLNEYLDENCEISLELLKLYYGEMSSFSDLENIFGQNLHNTFSKLNIPVLDKTYAQYLKLSDKKFNEDHAKRLSNALTGLKRNTTQKRASLSEEHKENISKGLLKYYQENPNIAFTRTKKDKEFIKKDPIRGMIMSQVDLRAWGYKEAESIKKKLSKFMSKKEITSQEFMELMDETNPKSSKLKEFWQKNQWAKQIWSKCMEKSWERQREIMEFGLISEPIAQYSVISTKLLEKMTQDLGKDEANRLAKARTVFIKDENTITTEFSESITQANEDFNSYINSNQELLDAYNHTRYVNDIMLIKSIIKENPQLGKRLIEVFFFALHDSDIPDTKRGETINQYITGMLAKEGKLKLLNRLNKTIDAAYEIGSDIHRYQEYITNFIQTYRTTHEAQTSRQFFNTYKKEQLEGTPLEVFDELNIISGNEGIKEFTKQILG